MRSVERFLTNVLINTKLFTMKVCLIECTWKVMISGSTEKFWWQPNISDILHQNLKFYGDSVCQFKTFWYLTIVIFINNLTERKNIRYMALEMKISGIFKESLDYKTVSTMLPTHENLCIHKILNCRYKNFGLVSNSYSTNCDD